VIDSIIGKYIASTGNSCITEKGDCNELLTYTQIDLIIDLVYDRKNLINRFLAQYEKFDKQNSNVLIIYFE